MHKVKTGVQNMYVKCTGTSPRIFVMKGATVSPFYLLLCSGGVLI